MRNITTLSVSAILILSVAFFGACGKNDIPDDNAEKNKTEPYVADRVSKKDSVIDANVEIPEKNRQQTGIEGAEATVQGYLKASEKKINLPDDFKTNTEEYLKNDSDAYQDIEKYIKKLEELKIGSFVIKSPKTTAMIHNIISENSDYAITECEAGDKKAAVTVVGTTPDFESEKNKSMAGTRAVSLFMSYAVKSGELSKLFNADNDVKNEFINKFIDENSENIKSLFSEIAAESEKVTVEKTITLEYADKWLIEKITDSYKR